LKIPRNTSDQRKDSCSLLMFSRFLSSIGERKLKKDLTYVPSWTNLDRTSWRNLETAKSLSFSLRNLAEPMVLGSNKYEMTPTTTV
jgi:hypothetical protein